MTSDTKDNNQLIDKILNNEQNALNSINIFIKRINQINNDVEISYVSKINETIDSINSIMKNIKSDDTINGKFYTVESLCLLLKNQKKIVKYLEQIINKKDNIDMFLSQTFIDETIEFYEKMIHILKKYEMENHNLFDIIVKQISTSEVEKLNEKYSKLDIKKDNGEMMKYMKEIQHCYHTHLYAIELYYLLVDSILDNTTKWFPQDGQILFLIMEQIEEDKSFLVSKYENIEHPKSFLNPYYKNFGLIPLTKNLYINQIVQYMNIEDKANDFSEFVKIMQQKQYGVILIKKLIANPIIYDITSLMNPVESQMYEQKNKSTFGVNSEIINRYKTIQKKFTKNKWDFSAEIHNDTAEFFVILETTESGLYRILTNLMISYNKIYIRSHSIKNLINFIKSKKLTSSRVNNINKIEIVKALPKIFNPIKIDAQKIKTDSSFLDPKYLRNEIYISLNNYFLDLLDKKYQDGKKIKNNYTYGIIIHSEEFLNIFSDIITREFYQYLYTNRDEHEVNNISVNEVLASFIRTIYIYQRDFTKEIHDYFKNHPFKFVNNTDNSFQIKVHFTNMIDYVLNKIINANSNVYQLILYKINLLKISFV